jgi:hypothetical protein
VVVATVGCAFGKPQHHVKAVGIDNGQIIVLGNHALETGPGSANHEQGYTIFHLNSDYIVNSGTKIYSRKFFSFQVVGLAVTNPFRNPASFDHGESISVGK